MTRDERANLIAKLVDEALVRAATTPWDEIALADLAGAVGASLADLAAARITRSRLVEAIDRRLDQQALTPVTKVDRDEGVRDRLFEAAMRRFDAMEEHRAALMAILLAEDTVPSAKAARRARRLVTAAWLLEAAGVDTQGAVGLTRTAGLARILRKTEQAWRLDGPDLARTMSTLDQGLRDAEDWVVRFQKLEQADFASFLSGLDLKRWRFGKGREAPPSDRPVETVQD